MTNLNQISLLNTYKENCPRLDSNLSPSDAKAITPTPFCLTASAALESFYRQNTLRDEAKGYTEIILDNCVTHSNGTCGKALRTFHDLEKLLGI